jgi:fatty acid desaturase
VKIKNKHVYWIHRLITLIYLVAFILLGFGMLRKFDLEALIVFLILLSVFGWMMYLHFVASLEAEKGSERGRRISRFIAVILFLLFPIGTVLSLYLFYKTSAHEWQK